MSSLRSQAPRFRHFSVTFPGEHIVQVTLTRQDKLNCVDKATSREIAGIWEQFDQDESLWVGIITGAGRAFCTGADLIGESARRRGGLCQCLTEARDGGQSGTP